MVAKIFTAFALTLLLVGSAFGAEIGLELQIVQQPNTLTVGDRLEIELVADGDGLFAEPEITGETWALVDPLRLVAGTEPPRWRAAIAVLDIGEVPLPSFTLGHRSADGSQSELISTTTVKPLTVGSVLAEGEDEEPEAAPLKDPLGVEGWPWELALPWVLAFLALALPLTALILSRKRSEPSQAGPPPRSALAILESELDRLEARVGLDPAESVCDQLATGLRAFIGRRCSVPAMDMTSTELGQLAFSSSWPTPLQQQLPQITSLADQVRFARRGVATDVLHSGIGGLRGLASDLDGHLAARAAAAAAAVEASTASAQDPTAEPVGDSSVSSSARRPIVYKPLAKVEPTKPRSEAENQASSSLLPAWIFLALSLALCVATFAWPDLVPAATEDEGLAAMSLDLLWSRGLGLAFAALGFFGLIAGWVKRELAP